MNNEQLLAHVKAELEGLYLTWERVNPDSWVNRLVNLNRKVQAWQPAQAPTTAEPQAEEAFRRQLEQASGGWQEGDPDWRGV